MARIQLENVKKAFGKVQALDGINIDVKDKEFFVLFGPAGAGKTTILNCIAGIVMPEEGVVKFDDEIVNLTDPAHRNVAMVFENYALYPQMTVYDNMASALRSKLYKKDESEIKERVQWAAKIMKMEELLERLPSQLSNGQKQRVAMGRALVREPNVFLMDEPLAHLDAKLRNSMRTELKEMQANLGSTCIYVTHDFMEAMALGDRIAIINEGKIVQIGTGDDIYYLPCNEFTAQLMGDPQINIIDAAITQSGDEYSIRFDASGNEVVIPLPKDDGVYAKIRELGLKHADIGIR
ncbi:MAG: ABC transporter ATP-binding protein, partial [Lachnospiraceae bacterium]|nr:ABC transporter ATP-binding protein [Lachnospiraceae bacterium]